MVGEWSPTRQTQDTIMTHAQHTITTIWVVCEDGEFGPDVWRRTFRTAEEAIATITEGLQEWATEEAESGCPWETAPKVPEFGEWDNDRDTWFRWECEETETTYVLTKTELA